MFTTEITSKVRTAGDGMESVVHTSEPKRTETKQIERKTSLLPGRLVQVFPSSVIRNEKRKTINARTPKFVPYEPYAAAVKPMTPTIASKGAKKSKNHMDINTLISQMSQMKTDLNEFKPRPKLNSSSSIVDIDNGNPDNVEFQKKIEKLTKDNESLNDQLKQQVQVSNYRFITHLIFIIIFV